MPPEHRRKEPRRPGGCEVKGWGWQRRCHIWRREWGEQREVKSVCKSRSARWGFMIQSSHFWLPQMFPVLSFPFLLFVVTPSFPLTLNPNLKAGLGYFKELSVGQAILYWTKSSLLCRSDEQWLKFNSCMHISCILAFHKALTNTLFCMIIFYNDWALTNLTTQFLLNDCKWGRCCTWFLIFICFALYGPHKVVQQEVILP